MPRILIIIICVALSLALGVLFVWPKYQNFKSLQLQLENKETELQYRNEYYEQLFSLSEKFKEFETDLLKIDSALPLNSSSAALSFYNYLQRASSENGLIIRSMGSASLSSLLEAQSVQVISIPIEASGSYSSLKNFLKTLEKSARIIEVNDISFSSSDEEGLLSFQLGIQTHSY